jgi:hypothetical protein
MSVIMLGGILLGIDMLSLTILNVMVPSKVTYFALASANKADLSYNLALK